jgi:hypothetical protein
MSTVEHAVTETEQKRQNVRLQVVSEETPQVVSAKKRQNTGRTRRANGTMSEVRPGIWRLRVTVGYTESGSPIQVGKRFHGGKRDAERALAAWVTEIGAPLRPRRSLGR